MNDENMADADWVEYVFGQAFHEYQTRRGTFNARSQHEQEAPRYAAPRPAQAAEPALIQKLRNMANEKMSKSPMEAANARKMLRERGYSA